MLNSCIIEINNFTLFSNELKDFTLVDNINLKIKEGEYVAIVGSNGSGKSSFLKSILNLQENYNGEIFIQGILNKKFRNWGTISYLDQDIKTSFIGINFMAEEYIFSGSSELQIDKVEYEKYLDMLNLKNAGKKLFKNLSGGEKQKIGLIKCLLKNPSLLILDEPTSDLDLNSKNIINNLLVEINKKRKVTILMVTHDLDLIKDGVDRVVCLGDVFENHRINEVEHVHI
jgi:zinc transport system ATP-binding protein